MEYIIVPVAGAAFALGAGILVLSLLVRLYNDDLDWDLEKS